MDGWKSRKLWTTFVAMALICWAYVMSGYAHDLFNEFVLGILTASGLYKAASVFSQGRLPRNRESGSDK